SASLAQVNAMLREQLEQANVANQALSEDIRKLTMDWTKAREELQQREAEWRREEESFNNYFSSEHSRLLTLWRRVVSLRRHFSETKSMTERDLSALKSELSQAGRAVHATCLNLSGRLHLSESSASAAVEKQVLLTAQLEDKVRDVIQLQVRCDTEKVELSTRLNEALSSLERLKGQNLEKGRTIEGLTHKLETLVRSGGRRLARGGGDAARNGPS
ncbi:hypothetical protein Chor_008275, partial [Crotalus horridus]